MSVKTKLAPPVRRIDREEYISELRATEPYTHLQVRLPISLAAKFRQYVADQKAAGHTQTSFNSILIEKIYDLLETEDRL